MLKSLIFNIFLYIFAYIDFLMRQPIKKSIAKANNIKSSEPIYSLIVDGNNLLKISLVDKTMNSNGKEYGAVVTFLRILGNILRKKDFNYCTVVWDGVGSGVLRYEIYKDYKANRDKHYDLHTSETAYDKAINAYCKKVLDYAKSKSKRVKKEESDEEIFDREKSILKQILQELCIRQYEFENVEGDDIISYCVQNKKENEKIVIVSSDKDLTQLISDDVIVYNHRIKDFVTLKNALEKIGSRPDNVVLEKILCGDSSDNIKGINGIGEKTLATLFPNIKTERLDLSSLVRRSQELLDSRKAEGKKPLKSLLNIINGVTDGCQGNKIYEINKKIIDLSSPLLTKEAKKSLSDEMYAPIDVSELNSKNIYYIIRENSMSELFDENRFSSLFEPYSRIYMMEKKRYDNYMKSLND